jgi:predicted dehydrogenase
MNKKTGLTRRDFLRTAALTTAATAVPFIRSGKAEGADPLTFALIGCGGRGKGAALQAMEVDENVKVTVLADAFEERAKGFQKQLAAKGINVPDDMVFAGLDAYKKAMATDVDYVMLATPPGWRPLQFEAAVNAKKHVFAEKPVATDVVGFRKFMAAAKKSEQLKLSVVAGTQRRHERAYIETIKKIHDGAIGKIVGARSHCFTGEIILMNSRPEGISDLEWQLRNWYGFSWTCGDRNVSNHVHELDVINWALGSHPIEVVACGGRAWKTPEERLGNIWDNISCDYEYPNGIHLSSLTRQWFNVPEGRGAFVVGTKRESDCHDMGSEGRDSYLQEHVDLIASIRGTGPYYNEGAQIAESTMIAIIGREAAYTGQRLKWDEFIKSDLDLMPKNLSFDPDAKNPPPPIPRPGMPGIPVPSSVK